MNLDILPVSLLIALLVQVSCQTFKVLLYSLIEGRAAVDYFVSAGGFPSSHSAFVTALTAAVALRSGIASEITAVAAVFSIIVIYDSYRLRGQVEAQARVLNRILKRDYPQEAAVSERVGHTLPEIASGILFGAAVALLLTPLIG